MAAKSREEMTAAETAVEILGIGMVTPVGLSARQTAASVRTGIGRLGESYVTDRYGEMLVMGLVDLGELPGLCEELDDPDDPEQSLSPRHERLARLAGAALLEALGSHAPASLPLLLALPEPHPETRYAVGAEMIGILATQTERRFDPDLSRTYALGRAGGFAALDDAFDLLGGGDGSRDRRAAAPLVLVGAADSYLDLGLLYALDAEGRLKTGEVADGFVPGEGAAFLLLGPVGAAARSGRQPIARITGVGRAHEAGHLYSAEPLRGDGLAAAFGALFKRTGSAVSGDIACVYAGLNGESFWAKEWGVAQIRCAGQLREKLRIQHPADCFGDAGAALGLIMVGLGALDLSRGRIDGNCLVWSGADRGERGAALLAP
jgi:3-oxoacyl-[acyl-carrier-protein] synthase-1